MTTQGAAVRLKEPVDGSFHIVSYTDTTEVNGPAVRATVGEQRRQLLEH